MVENLAWCGHVSGRLTVMRKSFQDLNEFIQILFRLLDIRCGKGPRRNFRPMTGRKFCQLGAPVRRRKSRVQRIAIQ